MKVCKKCGLKKESNYKFFNKQKASKDGLRSTCKDCQKEYLKNYYKLNKEKLIKKQSEYQIKNKKKRNAYKKKWAKENKKKVIEAQKKYHKNNPHKKAHWEGKRRSIKANATPKWSDLQKIEILYQKAKWLESITGLKYHVDHVIPLQGENVCGLHIWENLQILENTLNFKKSNKL